METEAISTPVKKYVKIPVFGPCDNCIYKDHSITTTTANLNKINGFSWNILEILNDNLGLTSNEIYDKLSAFNKPKNHIRVFLYRLRYYGILELRKSDNVWLITDPYNDSIKRIINNKYSNTSATLQQHLSNRSATLEQQITKKPDLPKLPKQTRQLNIALFLEKEDLSEEERAVVVALADHYNSTSQNAKARPYVKVQNYSEFRERVGLSSKYREEDLQDIVIALEVRGFLYISAWGSRYTKIGLTGELLERLKNS